MIPRSEGISAHGCCGVVDGKWEGDCQWAGGWLSHNLQSTAIYMQLSTIELFTLPQDVMNRRFN